MQNVVRLASLNRKGFVGAVTLFEDVDEPTLAGFLAVGQHALGNEGLQTEGDAGAATPDDLRVSVSLEQAMAGEHFAKALGGDLVIGGVLQRVVEGMLRGFLLLALDCPHKVGGKKSDGAGQDAIAARYHRMGGGCSPADGFPGPGRPATGEYRVNLRIGFGIESGGGRS